MKLSIIAAALLLAGCASTYKPIRPNATYYPSTQDYAGVMFSYKLGVLRELGNKKYAKREDKKAIRLAAVKIINNTDKTLVVGQDIVFYSGNSEAVLIEPGVLHSQLKQGVPIYLLYMLLTPMKFYKYDEYGGVESAIPIGYAIGPGITIGNMATAGSANQSFLRELTMFNVIGKSIAPGATVHGIIGIRDIGYTPISLKFRGEPTN